MFFKLKLDQNLPIKKENTSRDHFNEYVEQFFTNLHPKDVVHVMCWKKFVLKSSSKRCCACNVLGKKIVLKSSSKICCAMNVLVEYAIKACA
jgi:hypothetical protein